MARVLFAHPLFLGSQPEEAAVASPYFPLGLLYLAAHARDGGHDVAVFDGTFATGPSDVAAALRRHRPAVVGISALLPSRADALALARLAAAGGALVVLGGPDPTAAPAAYLAEPAVDLVVHHEGERTMAAILDLVDAGRIDRVAGEPGIAYRAGGRVVVNEARLPIADLDSLPLPARDLVDIDRYLRVWEQSAGYSSLTITTSRGCPRGCTWCRVSVHGDGFRQRSPEAVAAEMLAIKQRYDVGRLRMVDDVDGIDRGWLERWAAAAHAAGAALPFETLSEPSRRDIPLLDIRDDL